MPSLPRGSVFMSEDKSWKCAECKTRFTKSKLLATHARHTKHKAYHCSRDATCRKVFNLRTAAIRHESSHSESKNHACSWCEKLFHRRDHCLEHEEMCGMALQPPTSRRNSMATEPLPDPGSGQQTNTGAFGFESTVAIHNNQRNASTTVPAWGSQESRLQDASLSRAHFPQHNDTSRPSSFEATAQLNAYSSTPEDTAIVQDNEDTRSAQITPDRDTIFEDRHVLINRLDEARRLIEALQIEKQRMIWNHMQETSSLRKGMQAMMDPIERFSVGLLRN